MNPGEMSPGFDRYWKICWLDGFWDRRYRLSLCHRLLQHPGRERLRALDRHAQGTRPDIIWGNTQRAADPKEYGVEIKFAHAIVMLQCAADRVDVRRGVLGFALFLQHLRHHVEDHFRKTDEL